MCKEVDVNLKVGLRRTASCEVHKVIPTLTKFDQSRDISLKLECGSVRGFYLWKSMLNFVDKIRSSWNLK